MFDFFKAPIEQRLIKYVWPNIDDIKCVLPDDHPALKYPIALQASTAVANLAIAATDIMQIFPAEKAKTMIRKTEILLFQRIEADHSFSYPVSRILRLRSEQNMWRAAMQGADPDSLSNLDTIIRSVYGRRLQQYQAAYYKGVSSPSVFGMVGFIGKRWLSEINGTPILHEDDEMEDGFHGLIFTTPYFSQVIIGVNAEIKK
jgi:hypothetical protein